MVSISKKYELIAMEDLNTQNTTKMEDSIKKSKQLINTQTNIIQKQQKIEKHSVLIKQFHHLWKQHTKMSKEMSMSSFQYLDTLRKKMHRIHQIFQIHDHPPKFTKSQNKEDHAYQKKLLHLPTMKIREMILSEKHTLLQEKLNLIGRLQKQSLNTES